MSDRPTLGRIVHYRIGGEDETPVLRPAIVVRDHGDDRPNLQVFLDGTYDADLYPDEWEHGFAHRMSTAPGNGVGQWRWPPRA